MKNQTGHRSFDVVMLEVVSEHQYLQGSFWPRCRCKKAAHPHNHEMLLCAWFLVGKTLLMDSGVITEDETER